MKTLIVSLALNLGSVAFPRLCYAQKQTGWREWDNMQATEVSFSYLKLCFVAHKQDFYLAVQLTELHRRVTEAFWRVYIGRQDALHTAYRRGTWVVCESSRRPCKHYASGRQCRFGLLHLTATRNISYYNSLRIILRFCRRVRSRLPWRSSRIYSSTCQKIMFTNKKNSVVWTVPTERPPFVGEVNVNFWEWRVPLA
jgi:hypothetical protein